MKTKNSVTLAYASLRSSGAAQAEPLKIRGSWVAPVANWASIWLEKKDLAVHFGQSYVFESSRYAGTPPMITAMANNELEIADLAYSTLPIAIENAGMDDLRVVADEFQDGNAGHRSDDFQAPADGPIKKVEDLKGKAVATNAGGSGVESRSRAMLRKHGLEEKRDYTIVEAPFHGCGRCWRKRKSTSYGRAAVCARSGAAEDRPPAVLHQQCDRRVAVLPVGRPQAVHRQEPSRPRRFHGGFAAHRALVSRPLNHQAGDGYLRPASPSSPPERFAWVYTDQDNYRDPNMLPDLAALQKNVDMTKDLGFVKASFDVKAHSDLSLIEEAAKRLK